MPSNLFAVVKQRMQVHGSKEMYKSIAQCARSVYRAEGLAAFYVSYPTTLCMTVPFTALQFTAYESISKVMNPQKSYNPLTHCVAGGLAGAFAAGLTTPLDVIKTLLQTRGTANDAEIRSAKGLFVAASIIKRQYGWAGFVRGLWPRIITTMPSTAICWYVAAPSHRNLTMIVLANLIQVVVRNGQGLLHPPLHRSIGLHELFGRFNFCPSNHSEAFRATVTVRPFCN